jgi:hypothetical protein
VTFSRKRLSTRRSVSMSSLLRPARSRWLASLTSGGASTTSCARPRSDDAAIRRRLRDQTVGQVRVQPRERARPPRERGACPAFVAPRGRNGRPRAVGSDRATRRRERLRALPCGERRGCGCTTSRSLGGTTTSLWPVAAGLLKEDVRGSFGYLALTYSGTEEALRFIVETARSRGLVCFDPHEEKLIR